MSPQQNKSVQPTPEQLMQLLDLQIASQRAKRHSSGRNRAMLIVGGLLLIFIAAGGALMLLMQMMDDLPRPAAKGTPATEMTSGNSQ